MDSTATVLSPSTETMSAKDREINRLIDDPTKSGDEEKDVLLNVLKQKLRYKHTACKSTHTN